MTRRRRNRHKGPPEAAFQVLLRALVQGGMGEQALRLRVLSVWDRAVGARIAARTQPRSYSHGCLWVQAASPTWQNELTFLRATIVHKINALLPKAYVKELRISCGALAPPAPSDAERKAELAPAPKDVERASRLGAHIADPAVRSAFIRLMATDLRHRQVGRAMRRGPQ